MRSDPSTARKFIVGRPQDQMSVIHSRRAVRKLENERWRRHPPVMRPVPSSRSCPRESNGLHIGLLPTLAEMIGRASGPDVKKPDDQRVELCLLCRRQGRRLDAAVSRHLRPRSGPTANIRRCRANTHGRRLLNRIERGQKALGTSVIEGERFAEFRVGGRGRAEKERGHRDDQTVDHRHI